ncbi:MAG: HRDC domain-containing protein [Marmoricola sp.]
MLGADPDEAPAPEPAPLLRLRDGLTDVVDTPEGLRQVASRVAQGTGPVALDAERASGYRYSARAYLIQLRREGAGTALIDPLPFEDLRILDEAFGDAEWILHAATQDLPCLREVALRPTAIFDTELAARLLGYPRVGLATLVEQIVGQTMRKEHSAADWSRRPLPAPWLEYAALDVEVLLELRETLAEQLAAAGKAGWAAEEFTSLLRFEPRTRLNPWRRTSGIHRVRGRRGLAAVRELWQARDRIAADRDVTPGRLMPDSALVTAARAMPRSRSALLATEGFHGRGAKRYAAQWMAALDTARELPDTELPPLSERSDGPPPARVWADRDPEAAARLNTARAAITEMCDRLEVPAENLLTPDSLRRVLWSPPTAPAPGADSMTESVSAALAGLGARAWQIELVAPVVAEAILHPQQPEETT